ncbi:unnamed protein product, partial [Strongylus vulgaris]
RLDGEPDIGVETPIGVVPKKGSINEEGLPNINWDELMSVPHEYWAEDAKEVRKFLEDQVKSIIRYFMGSSYSNPFARLDLISRVKSVPRWMHRKSALNKPRNLIYIQVVHVSSAVN